MRTNMCENHAMLRGTVSGLPTYSHSNHGEAYYTFPLRIPRLSGAEDCVNVVASAGILRQCSIVPGIRVEVEGEVRSFNNRSGRGSKLVITLFARTMEPTQDSPANQLVLTGVLCKPPVLRCTPLGRDICDLILAVNRRYGRADYLPCIVWGALAVACGRLCVGDAVRLEGRFQSRGYRKIVDGVAEDRTAFEISVMKLEKIEC